jgi:hypothetical protein
MGDRSGGVSVNESIRMSRAHRVRVASVWAGLVLWLIPAFYWHSDAAAYLCVLLIFGPISVLIAAEGGARSSRTRYPGRGRIAAIVATLFLALMIVFAALRLDGLALVGLGNGLLFAGVAIASRRSS